MKVFKLTEQQLQLIANILAEFPAKQVFNAIDMLRTLPLVEDIPEDKVE